MEEGTKAFVKEVKALPKNVRDEDCFKVNGDFHLPPCVAAASQFLIQSKQAGVSSSLPFGILALLVTRWLAGLHVIHDCDCWCQIAGPGSERKELPHKCTSGC